MSKITPTEFKNYEQKFFAFFERLLKNPDFQADSEENKEKLRNFLGFLLVEIESGNVLALWGSIGIVEEGVKEDLSAIRRRVKEHIISRGNYNPTAPLSLTEWRQLIKGKAWEKMKKLYQNNQELYYLLLSEMNEEDHQFVHRIFRLWKESDKIFPEEKEKKLTEEDWKDRGFIFEDLSKTFEKTQTKLEAKKKTVRRIRPFPLIQNSGRKLLTA